MSGVPKEPEAGEHGHRVVERRRKLMWIFQAARDTKRPNPVFRNEAEAGEEVTYPRVLAE